MGIRKLKFNEEDFKVMGILPRYYYCRLANFKVGDSDVLKAALDTAHRVVEERKSTYIVSLPEGNRNGSGTGKTHLGIGIMVEMFKIRLDVFKKLTPEWLRFVNVPDYSRKFHDAGYNRAAFCARYEQAFEDGSGTIKTMMIDGLGEEEQGGIQCIKELIHLAYDNMVQLIVTTRLQEDEITERYGHGTMRRLSQDAIGILLSGDAYKG